MANINDYLLWRGDVIIDNNNPINEIDRLILARFSYLRFDMIELEENDSISDIYIKMKDIDNKKFRYNGDKELITNLAGSKRFRDLIASDYVFNSNRDIEKQFSAITIHLSNRELYISFIGTDSTIVGWKEDFNMAFMENVPAQIDGLNYTKNIMKKYKNKNIRIGGHSKGGNISLFASLSLSDSEQNRIISVDNYDGPGFNAKRVMLNKNKAILDKITTYIPQDSVIGRLFNHDEKHVIVNSYAKGIYQHDVYSWNVMGSDIVRSEVITKNSEIVNSTIKDWLNKLSLEQRKIFVDSIFHLFYATKASTFREMSKNIALELPNIYHSYKEITDEDKKIVNKVLREFIKSYFDSVKQINKKSLNDLLNR